MIATDVDTLRRIDRMLGDDAPLDELLAALDAANWQVRQAALQGLERRAPAAAVPAIVSLLDRQDALDLYGAPEPWTLKGAPNPDVEDAWRCRFRVKQAACHALGAIGKAHGADRIGARAVDRLAAYACSQKDDYCVRAAACQALGRMRAAGARAALAAAEKDGEWCTHCEAAKALVAIGPEPGAGR